MLGGRLLGTAMALALTLGGVLGGCGSTTRATPVTSPDAGASACRAQWQALGQKIKDKAARTEPSALPERWTNLSATVDYFRTSARTSDCGARLTAEQQAITTLEAFSARLAPYDVQHRLAAVRAAAEKYAASPAPKTPRKAKSRKPAPAAVKAAVTTLVAQAPLAAEQQGPAWQQASVVDLSSSTATAKAVKDLAFLSTQSPAYVASSAALATIAAALKTD